VSGAPLPAAARGHNPAVPPTVHSLRPEFLIPRDKAFWLYHGGVMALAALVTVATSIVWSSGAAQSAWSTLAWMAWFTVAMLAFRQGFLRLRGWRLSTPRLVIAVGAYGLVAGMLVMAATTACVLPFFWQHTLATERALDPGFDAASYVVHFVVGGGLQTQLFVCAWAFIYTSVSAARRAASAELSNALLQDGLKTAQLASLASQLNPHFLFNALNNIRFLIHEDADQAERGVVALSDILRHALETSRRPTVPLREELALLDDYVAIVRLQHEDRLEFVADVPEPLRDARVPPLVLQLLMENAVKHGVDQLRDGGRVEVRARAHPGGLQLRVGNSVPDDGAAADAAATLGLGLENIRRRLELLYGPAASLAVRRAPARFEVTLQIPFETAQETPR